MNRALLPALLALACATASYLVADSVDRRFEATASVRIDPFIPGSEIDRIRIAAGLSRIDERPERPLLPDGNALERVARRTERSLGLRRRLDPKDVRVIDTAAELVFPEFQERKRRLKVKALAAGREASARTANAFLSAYLAERDRAYARLLSETRRRLLRGNHPRLRGAARPLLLEAAEATRIIEELDGGVFFGERHRARPPEEAKFPKVTRDALVGGLIGALAGWLITRRRHRGAATKPTAPAPASRVPRTPAA